MSRLCWFPVLERINVRGAPSILPVPHLSAGQATVVDCRLFTANGLGTLGPVGLLGSRSVESACQSGFHDARTVDALKSNNDKRHGLGFNGAIKHLVSKALESLFMHTIAEVIIWLMWITGQEHLRADTALDVD